VLKGGTLRELHAATGGPWGGQLVNEAFMDFMGKLVHVHLIIDKAQLANHRHDAF